ncbi:MAG: glycosyltransferase [Saprospiraceae bacterium]|nr:glycosyltransferase [Saprospiraceae bacterium]
MLISTVICTHNRSNILKICLEHVQKQDLPKNDFEIIIINNNSTDTTEDVAQDFIIKNEHSLNIRYYFEGKPGLSAARNRGIIESKGDFINFIDDDALLPKEYLSNLKKNIVQLDNALFAGIGGKIIPRYFGHEPEWMSYFTWGLVSKHDLGEKQMKYEKIGLYPTGCNMTYKKTILQKVGLFDEALLRRCDDKYIAYEIKKYGGEIWYCPDVALEHFIDEDRINNRLDNICFDSGLHEKLRIRNNGYYAQILKFTEYIFKFFSSFLLLAYYSLKSQPKKGLVLVKMRWLFLIGFIK